MCTQEQHKQHVDVIVEDQADVVDQCVARGEQNPCMGQFKAQLEALSEAFTQQKAELSELKKRMTFLEPVLGNINVSILKSTGAVVRLPEVERQVKSIEEAVLMTVDRIVQEVASLSQRVRKVEVGCLQTTSITEKTLSVKEAQLYTDIASTTSGSFSRHESLDEEYESLAETTNKTVQQWMSFVKDAQLHTDVSSIASGSFSRQSTDEEDDSIVDTSELRAAIDSLIKPPRTPVGSAQTPGFSVSNSTTPVDHKADVKGKPVMSPSNRGCTPTSRRQFGQATPGSPVRSSLSPSRGPYSAYPLTVRGEPFTLSPLLKDSNPEASPRAH